MSASEEIRRLESELELDKQNLHEDAVQIRHKIDETKAELSPTNLVRRNVYLILGVAFSIGFIAGYFPEWRRIRPEQVARPVLEHIGKPAAHTMASTAGKQLITNTIRE
jgi:hypothetical protein